MQEKNQKEQHGATGGSNWNDSSRPPCCGSGCAVCVLDYWTVDEPGSMAQAETSEEISSHQLIAEVKTPADSDLLELLEAFEQAQLDVQQTVAQLDGKRK